MITAILIALVIVSAPTVLIWAYKKARPPRLMPECPRHLLRADEVIK